MLNSMTSWHSWASSFTNRVEILILINNCTFLVVLYRMMCSPDISLDGRFCDSGYKLLHVPCKVKVNKNLSISNSIYLELQKNLKDKMEDAWWRF